MKTNSQEKSAQNISRLPIVVWILIILGVTLSPLSSTIISYDGDATHHALLGKIIISKLSIPAIEPTAFTAPDKIFIAHEWLAEIAYGAFDNLLGPTGIALLAAILLGACLYLVTLSLERSSVPNIVIIFIIPIIFLLVRIHFVARPHLFTWLLFILLYLTVDEFRRGLLNIRSLTLRLGIIFICWANLHGSFIFGYCCLAILLISPMIFDRKRDLNLSTAQAALLFIFIAICTMINPYGVELHNHIISFLLTGGEIRKQIDEFGNITLDTFWYVIATSFFLGIAFFSFYRRKKINLEDYLLVIALVVLTFYSIRMSTYLFLVLPLIALNSYSQKIRSGFYYLTFSIIFTFSAAILIIISRLPNLSVRFDNNLLPVEGVEFLKMQGNLKGLEIFNFYDWGGYLAYELYPDIKVFIHGLNDHYGLVLLNQYNQIIGQLDKSEDILSSYKIKRVIFPNNTPLVSKLLASSNWKAIYQDSTCVILDRNN